jgi:hypothetical protein
MLILELVGLVRALEKGAMSIYREDRLGRSNSLKFARRVPSYDNNSVHIRGS